MPKKCASLSADIEKKEGGSGGALPPCQVPSPDLVLLVAGGGARVVAMAAATLSTIAVEGLMWDPVQGHSENQYMPMC